MVTSNNTKDPGQGSTPGVLRYRVGVSVYGESTPRAQKSKRTDDRKDIIIVWQKRRRLHAARPKRRTNTPGARQPSRRSSSTSVLAATVASYVLRRAACKPAWEALLAAALGAGLACVVRPATITEDLVVVLRRWRTRRQPIGRRRSRWRLRRPRRRQRDERRCGHESGCPPHHNERERREQQADAERHQPAQHYWPATGSITGLRLLRLRRLAALGGRMLGGRSGGGKRSCTRRPLAGG